METTVTSRIPVTTKTEAQRILKQNGTNPSRVINELFDRIVEEGGIDFLSPKAEDKNTPNIQNFARAIDFVDSIPVSRNGMYDDFSSSEIKLQILKGRGLL